MSLNAPSPPPGRRGVSVTVFVVALLLVGGAAIAATAAYYELRPPTAPAGDLKVTDDLGRTVEVPRDPGRVVVLGPSIMDSMARLGLRSHVVGVDCYSPAFGGLSSDYSSDQIAEWNLSTAMCVQTDPQFENEQLLNLTPSLVLATTIVSVSAVETVSVTDGVPVVMLQPATLGGISTDLSLLGEIFGVGTAASTLGSELQSELANASAVANSLEANFTSFPTVLVTYSTDSNGYWTYGPGTFGESLIELASATSISANATMPYPELAGEQVLVDNPSLIVYGTGFGLNESSYSQAPFWSDLSAVSGGHVYGLDSNYLTEPDPTMVLLGLPALIALFHPGVGP